MSYLLSFNVLSFSIFKSNVLSLTTGEPARRENELLGTISPVKVAIRKAWGNISAREVESMLHDLLNNCRLDGEYFWDGNETLIDSVSSFIERYYPKAKLLVSMEDTEVKAAEKALTDARSIRVIEELVPELERLQLNYKINKKGSGVIIALNEYRLRINTGQNDKYTLYVYSTTRDGEQALKDFQGTEIPSFRSKDPEESTKKAMMGVKPLDKIIASIKRYQSIVK
jgi:hypothetical protein